MTLVVGLRSHEHWEATLHVLAIFVHDWAATLLTVVWLAGFWAFAQRWILDTGDPRIETIPG
jgi:hypothetical protein